MFNQLTEIFSVNQIAERIKRVGDERGLNVQIRSIENPRVELEEHYYNPASTGLLDLGLEPHYLSDEIINGFFDIAEKYKSNINRDAIFRGISWK